MIRKWQYTDIPVIADAIISIEYLDDISCDRDEYIKWLAGLYSDHRVTAFLEEEDTVVSAVVGIKLDNYFHPPHFSFVDEWCLWGVDKRAIVDIWKRVRQWGIDHGAVYVRRGRTDGIREHFKWESLR